MEENKEELTLNLELESDPELESEPETRPEPDTEPEPEPEPEPEAKAEPEPKPVQELEPSTVEEDNSEDNDDETWDEVDQEIEIQIICLFCPQTFKTMAIALEHCKEDHDFNLMDMKIKFNMDCYSYLCMVNYIRKERVSPEAIKQMIEIPWNNETYLSPIIEDDAWLMFDFEGMEVVSGGSFVEPNSDALRSVVTNVKRDNDLVTLSEGSFSYLQKSLRYYAEEIHKKDALLRVATEQINEMKNIAHKIFSGDLAQEEREVENRLYTLKLSDDNGYFKTYSHYGIHLEMLSDKIRMLSFREAIFLNRSLFSGKTVLDVGCGSGILSLFSACAGASKVYGVDKSDIIFNASDIVRENQMTSKIELLHGKIEEVILPVDKVDIIVSEWLGYFLLFEGMLDSVLYARDKYLKPDGRILPDRCNLFIMGVSDHENYNKMVKFWKGVYGFKMSSMAKEVLQEAAIIDIPPEAVATSPALVLELNLYFDDVRHTNFRSEFTLKSCINGEVTALCGYFIANFYLPHEVSFSTSPQYPKTHWKQTIFFLTSPIKVDVGTVLKGYIECKRKLEDNRALVITIQIQNQRNTYFLG